MYTELYEQPTQIQYTVCWFSRLLRKKGVQLFVLDLSIHICIHEEKAFLLSSISSIALHFIWQPTQWLSTYIARVGSVLSPLETQGSQIAS